MPSPHLAHIDVVGVVLRRHEQQLDALRQLDTIERHHAHVQEDPEQDCDRDLAQKVSDHNRQT